MNNWLGNITLPTVLMMSILFYMCLKYADNINQIMYNQAISILNVVLIISQIFFTI